MKENVGRQGLKYQDISSIEKYCTYANVVKQNLLDYIQLITPLIADKVDKKTKDQLFHTITSIFFGDEIQESKPKIKPILSQMQKALKNIKTLGIEELTGEKAAATLKKISQ